MSPLVYGAKGQAVRHYVFQRLHGPEGTPRALPKALSALRQDKAPPPLEPCEAIARRCAAVQQVSVRASMVQQRAVK